MNITRTNDDVIPGILNVPDRVAIELSPGLSKRDYDPENATIAVLLSWQPDFNKRLKSSRSNMNLKKLYKYPEDPAPHEVVNKVFVPFSKTNKISLLEILAEGISEAYKLDSAWVTPIKVAILTNTLLVPPKTSPIRIYLPSKHKLARGRTNLFKDLVDRAGILNYPAVVLTKRSSINELKNWINENKDIIRTIQESSPKKVGSKTKPLTLMWGQIAYILKQNGVTSWEAMSRGIQRNLKDTSIERYENAIGEEFLVPSGTELQRYYTRFIKALKTIKSSNNRRIPQ